VKDMLMVWCFNSSLFAAVALGGLACDWQVFQLTFAEEVQPSLSTAKRSQTTGHLLITMPKVLPL